MKKFGKHIVLAILFVVCAVTTIWAISYDNNTPPMNNETTSGIVGDINVPVKTVKDGVVATSSTITNKQYGETIEVTAPVESGYVFLYWLDGARNKILSYQSTFNYRILSATPDLRAVYLLASATRVVFLDANQNQIATVAPVNTEGVLSVAAPVSNLVPVRPGYEITGWSQNLSNLTVDENGVAYVQAIYSRDLDQFTTPFTVHVGDALIGSYGFDSVATVTADATSGEKVFSHWTIDGQVVSYSRTYSFTVHANTVLTPVYASSATPNPMSYISHNYFTYEFGYNKQLTFVGRYELPQPLELVETGMVFLENTLVGELTINTPNAVKVESTRQNNLKEFTITYLNGTVFVSTNVRSYMVYLDGSSLVTVYGELLTIDALTQTEYFYNFEDGTKTAYAEESVLLNGMNWTLNDALIGTTADDRKFDSKSIRIRNGYIMNNTPFEYGVKSITFYYAKYGSDGNSTINVEIATSSSNPVFINLATISVNSTTFTKVTINANFSNSALIRITKTGTTRVNIDNLSINTPADTIAPVFSGLSNKEVIIGQSFDRYAGVTALDNVDGNVTSRINATGTVDTNTLGVYYVEYTVSDYSGNTTTQTISIEVVDIPDAEKADIAAANLTKPAENTEYTNNFTLSVTSSYGSTVEWISNNAAIAISGANATVTRPTDADVNVRLTWTLTLSSEVRTGYIDVIVKLLITSSGIKYTETFNSNPLTGTSYTSGNFVGENGNTWNYVNVRGDQTIEGKALTLQQNNAGYISTSLTNGISELSFKYVRAFTGTGVRSIDVVINGTVIDTITISSTSDTVMTYTKSLNISGDYTLVIRASSSNAGQVKIDTISWTTNP